MANQQRLDKLNALRQNYSQQLPQRIQEIKSLWRDLVNGDKSPI